MAIMSFLKFNHTNTNIVNSNGMSVNITESNRFYIEYSQIML